LKVSPKRHSIDVAPCVPYADTGLVPRKIASVHHLNSIDTFAFISARAAERAVVEA
jgi:hypothetical protein